MGRFTDFIQSSDSFSDLNSEQKTPENQNNTEATSIPNPPTSPRTWKSRKKK